MPVLTPKLVIAPFRYSDFLCCLRPFFGLSMVSAKNTSSVIMFALRIHSLFVWQHHPHLKECLLLETFFENKKVTWFHFADHLVIHQINLMIFYSTLKQIVSDVTFPNSTFVLIVGEFNAKISSSWQKNSITSQGIQIVALTYLFLWAKPTYF